MTLGDISHIEEKEAKETRMCVKLESAPDCTVASVRIPHSGNLAKTIFQNAEPWEEVNLLRRSVGSQATQRYSLRAGVCGFLG